MWSKSLKKSWFLSFLTKIPCIHPSKTSSEFPKPKSYLTNWPKIVICKIPSSLSSYFWSPDPGQFNLVGTQLIIIWSIDMENVAQPSSSPPKAENAPVQAPPAAEAALPVMQRWRRVDLMDKVTLVLRSLGCAFSFLTFVIMASNKHGDWMEFGHYQEFRWEIWDSGNANLNRLVFDLSSFNECTLLRVCRYVLIIGVLGFLYSAIQIIRQVVVLGGFRNSLWSERASAIVNFAGDQIIAYLMISAISSAIPMINRMRVQQDNIFTSSVAASLSMAFFAFLAFAISSVASGYRLSIRSSI